MPLPRNRPARSIWKAAFHRFEEAEVLYHAAKYTGSVYLGGYTVECIIKAFVLDKVPIQRSAEILQLFRGNQAHNYSWLLRLVRTETHLQHFPQNISKAFRTVSEWNTSLRYVTTRTSDDDAQDFLSATRLIRDYFDGLI